MLISEHLPLEPCTFVIPNRYSLGENKKCFTKMKVFVTSCTCKSKNI